eukprot:c5287_g1_i1.p1 GENE.c5287_g1_i1~~c5287_g1_i1.p1  ORF type:complete len:130 (+),score=8.82 c5287_g1_i1:1-390(+)
MGFYHRMIRFVVLALLASLHLSEAVSCVQCVQYLKAFSSYCEAPRVGRFAGVCSEVGQSARDQAQCLYLARRVQAYSHNTFEDEDGCLAVEGLSDEKSFQNRLQLCCSPHVLCDTGGQGFAQAMCPWNW